MNSEEKEKLRELLLVGTKYSSIQKEIKTTKANISAYAKIFGIPRKTRKTYNWKEIEDQLAQGVSEIKLRKKYGYAKRSLAKAVATGKIRYAKIRSLTAKEYAEHIKKTNPNSNIRRKMTKLLKQEGREYKCELCETKDWNGEKLTLDLDHIDGNRLNNDPDNLRFLCPNCHSQTETWRGRNTVKSKAKKALVAQPERARDF